MHHKGELLQIWKRHFENSIDQSTQNDIRLWKVMLKGLDTADFRNDRI